MKITALIKNGLGAEDKKIFSNIDLEKTDEEIIADLIKAKLLNFNSDEHDNKKNCQNK